MGDLREDLISLAEESEQEAARNESQAAAYRVQWIANGNDPDRIGTGEAIYSNVARRDRRYADDLRSLLARHPAPSPSVSRDAETGRTAWRCGCGIWNHAACRACGKGPDERWASGAELDALGFEDARPVGGCADALGLAPSPRSEAGRTEVGGNYWPLADEVAPFPAESATKGEEDGR